MVENFPHEDDDVSLPFRLQGHQIHAFDFDMTPLSSNINAERPKRGCKSSLNTFYSLDSGNFMFFCWFQRGQHYST